ncbi:acyl-CoA dehydrogenase family protein [Mucilaginibacter auburnensis]|uniref:Alkylation response protein AidB-like acyl-CoA dehydrogenase n=1 Tax=Mucilaginibacter auburnensis TaxID=1457233 RepID=A0A2H9VQ62_9SPHI|nr:acyl-CoA dehydrogenase [Mucilaginibacter auburnensis]PJJ80463.1 alkylation response protein AidB-like acyl-CoA dehydrogenase [Mucilaginibacter auburnensis]
MGEIHHPSKYIDARYVDLIRTNAAEAEQLGKLNADALEIVYREKWFRLLVPAIYGGREITLPELVRLQESISWTDGSTGWVVTLCSGAGWFGGFIDPDAAKEIYKSEEVCLAGSGAASGTAEQTDTGYILNGEWNYASGAYHATHFTANCFITRNGERLLNEAGEPLILPFVVDKKDVTLLPTWKYMGMVATGSHSFEMEDVHVPANRCFKLDPEHAQVEGKLYKYPFMQLAEATLAVNLSGMAVHFVDLCREVFADRKGHPRVTPSQTEMVNQALINQAEELDSARIALFKAVDASWSDTTSDNLKQVSKTSRILAATVRDVVSLLYPYCGLKAADPTTEINRVWRDLHTAGQHSLLTFLDVADD